MVAEGERKVGQIKTTLKQRAWASFNKYPILLTWAAFTSLLPVPGLLTVLNKKRSFISISFCFSEDFLFFCIVHFDDSYSGVHYYINILIRVALLSKESPPPPKATMPG